MRFLILAAVATALTAVVMSPSVQAAERHNRHTAVTGAPATVYQHQLPYGGYGWGTDPDPNVRARCCAIRRTIADAATPRRKKARPPGRAFLLGVATSFRAMARRSFEIRPRPMHETSGAFFVPHDIAAPITGSGDGPLAGLNAAVKDMYDIAGFPTGAGSPTWLATHAPAKTNAAAVAKILAAGATIIGKTICDELFFSVTGVNTTACGRPTTASISQVPC